jgi:endonuclease/exonuclease/phosphatase family metal-dependent hydrolase
MSFLQIASWNIEHLSGQPRAQRKQSAFALADHIEMAGIDIIVLQEVYVTQSDEEVRLAPNQPVIASRAKHDRRNSDLDMVCYLLEEHLDHPWSYQIIPNRQAGDKSQLCAVMWNTKSVSLESMTPLAVSHSDGGDVLWDRKPHLLSFTSDQKTWRRDATGEWREQEERRRFSLVPLHMKSNYGGVTKNRGVRAKEAATLCAALKDLEGKIDPSLILIGDTNVLNNAEPAIEIFVNSGFIDLNNNDGATYWSSQYHEAPFDRVFVASGRPEFRFTRQYIMRSSDLNAHDHFLSDHYMIKVSVKDYLDDNDPR